MATTALPDPVTQTSKPNLNPSPKERFLESRQNISDHRAMVETRTFQRAIDYSLLQYQIKLTEEISANPQMAGGQAWKLAGVTEFVAMLKTFSETPTIVRRIVTDNLDHKA